MGKIWKRIFLVCGSLVFIAVALLGTFAFSNDSIDALQEKYSFDSQYLNSNIDFIIPSPKDSQISEMENDETLGIKAVNPFYYAEMDLQTDNNKNISANVLMFAYSSKMEYTPYNSNRIIKGKTTFATGDAIVDYTLHKEKGCNIGDTLSLTVSGIRMDFEVVAISETNLSYDHGSVAFVLSQDTNANLIENGVNYSSAFVAVDNLASCETYLLTNYKPLGRLKDASSFDSEETYNKHVENFNNADWSKEITNISRNYDTLAVKYENLDNAATRNIIIVSILIGLSVIAFQAIVLLLPGIKQSVNKYIVKTGKRGSARLSFGLGAIYNGLVCSLIYVLTVLVTSNVERGIFDSNFAFVVINPVISCTVGVFVAFIISISAIKKAKR